MRLIANVESDVRIERLMIYECKDGVYLFLYDTKDDSGCLYDLFFTTVKEAIAQAEDGYGVKPSAWSQIPDPPEGCQHDWIAPVRIAGRDQGNPERLFFEVSKDGKWMPLG